VARAQVTRIDVQRHGDIATVVLDGPAKRNALARESWLALTQTMRSLAADDSLRCVVLRGAGDEAFAAGADISEFPRLRADSAQGRDYGAIIHGAMLAVAECAHPTIAMIRGVCVGGGLEVALACDLRICGEGSRFGVPVKRLGLTMGYGELAALIAVVGSATALEILLEGRVFGAREAHDKRLVHRVVADADVESEAYASARRIAAGAPLVARWHKRFIRRLVATRDIADQQWKEGFACFDTDDFREGMTAFLDKRDPVFKGR